MTEVSICCQKNPEVGIRHIPAYTPQYTTAYISSDFDVDCTSCFTFGELIDRQRHRRMQLNSLSVPSATANLSYRLSNLLTSTYNCLCLYRRRQLGRRQHNQATAADTAGDDGDEDYNDEEVEDEHDRLSPSREEGGPLHTHRHTPL